MTYFKISSKKKCVKTLKISLHVKIDLKMASDREKKNSKGDYNDLIFRAKYYLTKRYPFLSVTLHLELKCTVSPNTLIHHDHHSK